MSSTAIALIGLVGWSLTLTLVLVIARFSAVFKGEGEINKFRPDGTDLNPLGGRITRAHANSLEYIALPNGLMLLAIASGNVAVTDGLATVFLGCRVAQSVVHTLSTSRLMVLTRATFFTVQIVIMIIWACDLYHVT